MAVAKKPKKKSKSSPRKPKGDIPRPSEVRAPSVDLSGASENLAIGYRPSILTPQDAALFRAFQANLLSLISHEMRTPLMNILNSLNLLEGGETPAFKPGELVAIARKNAQRLHRTMQALLDLASLESGSFHVRVREVELLRLVRGRVDAQASIFKDRMLSTQIDTGGVREVAVLVDPGKMGRAADLCIQSLVPRAREGSQIKIRINPLAVQFEFELDVASVDHWTDAWSHALAGHEGGVNSPGSAFAGTLQSEQAFLTREEEGLGSEFLLIHEILRLHSGRFECAIGDSQGEPTILTLHLPELSSEAGLKTALAARVGQVSTEFGAVALALIQVPKTKPIEVFRDALKKSLFRATDTAYVLPGRHQVGVLLDDCKPEDAPRLIKRIEKVMGQPLVYGVAIAPDDGLDPQLLLEIADQRLKAVVGRAN